MLSCITFSWCHVCWHDRLLSSPHTQANVLAITAKRAWRLEKSEVLYHRAPVSTYNGIKSRLVRTILYKLSTISLARSQVATFFFLFPFFFSSFFFHRSVKDFSIEQRKTFTEEKSKTLTGFVWNTSGRRFLALVAVTPYVNKSHDLALLPQIKYKPHSLYIRWRYSDSNQIFELLVVFNTKWVHFLIGSLIATTIHTHRCIWIPLYSIQSDCSPLLGILWDNIHCDSQGRV